MMERPAWARENGCVPTVVCECLLAKDVLADDNETVRFKAGEMLVLPYAQALQMTLLGTVGAIKDADDKHAEALDLLMTYGGDSWFAPPHQTAPKIIKALSNPEGAA